MNVAEQQVKCAIGAKEGGAKIKPLIHVLLPGAWIHTGHSALQLPIPNHALEHWDADTQPAADSLQGLAIVGW